MELLYFVFISLCTHGVIIDCRTLTEYSPDQKPALCEGTFRGTQTAMRLSVNKRSLLWPDGVIPFTFSNDIRRRDKNLIQSAMDLMERYTCIRFKVRSSERDYVSISALKGCVSEIGRMGGRQILSLGRGCMYFGTVVHELGHAIGFYHEHDRPDRDKYLNVFWENIEPGRKSQFQEIPASKSLMLNSFDANSIMIYGEYAFSRNGKKTMVSKQGIPLREPYEKSSPTRNDFWRINKLYRCQKKRY